MGLGRVRRNKNQALQPGYRVFFTLSTAGIGDRTVQVDVPFSEILDELNFGFKF